MPQVQGGTFHLRSRPFHPVLLAFLQTVPDTEDTPSRDEVAILQSMSHQYGDRGLRVVLVDASALAGDGPAGYSALINSSYDWQLRVPLLEDAGNRVARRFGVTTIPTMILLGADGTVVQRWEGLTRPAVLALGIERLFGGPVGGRGDSSDPLAK